MGLEGNSCPAVRGIFLGWEGIFLGLERDIPGAVREILRIFLAMGSKIYRI